MCLIFYMLSLLSFKNQLMQFFLCCQDTFSKQWMDFYMLPLQFHLAVDVVFHKLPLLSFKEQWMLFPMCYHITSIRQWMIFICCHYCFTNQCLWLSTCCDYPLSKSSGFGFLCVFTAHLINSERCSICCHCCALRNVWGFPHVVTALFQASVDAVFLVLSRHTY